MIGNVQYAIKDRIQLLIYGMQLSLSSRNWTAYIDMSPSLEVIVLG